MVFSSITIPPPTRPAPACSYGAAGPSPHREQRLGDRRFDRRRAGTAWLMRNVGSGRSGQKPLGEGGDEDHRAPKLCKEALTASMPLESSATDVGKNHPALWSAPERRFARVTRDAGDIMANIADDGLDIHRDNGSSSMISTSATSRARFPPALRHQRVDVGIGVGSDNPYPRRNPSSDVQQSAWRDNGVIRDSRAWAVLRRRQWSGRLLAFLEWQSTDGVEGAVQASR